MEREVISLEKILEMKDIRKTFGNNVALNSVDFHCKKGEVICLLGENGAGKSTLMKILYGLYKKDSGEIWHKGELMEFEGPRDAISRGIQMVHQHFMLVDTLSVVDNIMIGKEAGNFLYFDRVKAGKIVAKLSEDFGLKVPLDRLIKDISVGERQRVEIIKALYQGADILILDEPTAVLTPQEVEELFKVIYNLRESGKTIIMITHKLKETMAISDRVYVLRQGRMMGERIIADTSIDELSELMIGRQIPKCKKIKTEFNETLLQFKDVKFKDINNLEILKGITFDIKKGEILGIAGVEGNGQSEIINVLFGLQDGWTGDIVLDGKSIKGKDTEQLIAEGIYCIHSDRQSYNIAQDLNVPYNFLMGSQNNKEFIVSKYFIDWETVKKKAMKAFDIYDVRPRDITRCLSEFSGGNQQKFVVGREILRKPKLMIAGHPTRGVDIMACSFVHRELNGLKRDGVGILLISSDLDELLELSDRIAVVHDGRCVEIKDAEDYTLMELGKLMGGGKSHEEQFETIEGVDI